MGCLLKKEAGPLARLLFAVALACVVAKANCAFAQNGAWQGSWYAQSAESLFVGGNAPFVDLSKASGWGSGLSVTGYAQNTSGMWANSAALTDSSSGRNSGS